MSNAQDEAPVENPRRPSSPWSFQVATVSGIPVRIHFTFLLLLVWFFVIGGRNIWTVLFVCAVFFCVILHEFGHAIVARKYGVQTRDITLYPMGGVAMLQGRPKPAEEFWIALAGPAVNVVIAIVLGAIIYFKEGHPPHFTLNPGPQTSILEALFSANVWLPAFNMIPAFPMDGGRVLRAVLAHFTTEARATQIAGAIGQFLAIGFGFLGLIQGNVLFMIIAFFVFLGASQEVQSTVGLSLVAGKKVKDAMQTRFRVIPSGASMDEAAQMLLSGSQHDFPVVAGDEVIGLLSRTDIARGLAEEGTGAYVAGYMNRELRKTRPEEPLESAFDSFTEGENAPLLVMEEDRLIGMLTSENLSEFIMLEHAKSQRAPAPRA